MEKKDYSVRKRILLRMLFLLLLILIVMVLNTSLQGENKFNSGHGVI